MPKYEPRARNNKLFKIGIPILIACIVLAFVFVNFVGDEEEEDNGFKICDLTSAETLALLEAEEAETYTVSDYFFYGETINLFQDAYDPEESDDIVSKTVKLVDLCSDTEYTFTMTSYIDAQINLSEKDLQEGYFAIYVLEDYTYKRVVYDGTVDDSFKTITRNETNYEVTLLADTEYFAENDVSLAANYLFITMEETELDEDEYDVVIDPAKLDADYTWTTDYGDEDNGLYEYEETYKAAIALQEVLEAKGLKVLVLRDEDETIDTYGTYGRLAKAYKSSAKYYIRICFPIDSYGYEGMSITYSAHSKGKFADDILYYLSKHTDVQISTLYNTSNPGSFAAELYEGMDGRYCYDANMYVRESGGYATQAGLYSENAESGTGAFAEGNRHGMYGIDICLGDLSSTTDTNYWKNHQDEYVEALAAGMYVYWNIE